MPLFSRKPHFPPTAHFSEISSEESEECEECAERCCVRVTLLSLVDKPKAGLDLEICVGEKFESFSRKKKLGGWALIDRISGSTFLCTDLARAPQFDLEISSISEPEVSFRLDGKVCSMSLRHVGQFSAIFPDSVCSVTCQIGPGNLNSSVCFTLALHAQLLGPSFPECIEEKLKTLNPNQASDWLEAAPLLTTRGVVAAVQQCSQIRNRLDALATRPEFSVPARARLVRALLGSSHPDDIVTVERLVCGCLEISSLRDLLGVGGDVVFKDVVVRQRILERLKSAGRNFQVVIGDASAVVLPGLNTLAKFLKCSAQVKPDNWDEWKAFHPDSTILLVGMDSDVDLADVSALSLAVECHRKEWISKSQLEEVIGNCRTDLVRMRKSLTFRHEVEKLRILDAIETVTERQITQVNQCFSLDEWQHTVKRKRSTTSRVIRVSLQPPNVETEKMKHTTDEQECHLIRDFNFIPE